MEEQITKKDSLMPYIEELEDLSTKKILEPIKKSYVDKLNTLQIPMARIIERFNNYDTKIVNHWKKFGQNYDINPTLSLVPILQDSFSDYITMALQERNILVDFVKELLEKANEIKDTPPLPIIKPMKKKK